MNPTFFAEFFKDNVPLSPVPSPVDNTSIIILISVYWEFICVRKKLTSII